MSATAAATRVERKGDSSEVPAFKVEVRHLDFYYGETRALHDINLSLADKSITAFIGPSGCGKSTLLRVFNRMYALYPGHRAAGEVLLDGENILAAERGYSEPAIPCRHGVPEADPVSDVHF